MPKQNTCILCLENTKPLTDEHIVPDSIGGSLHAEILCKKCNSTLGEKVDGPFSKSLIIEFKRQHLGIEGKSGKIPNPFSSFGTHEHQGKEIKIRLNDSYEPYVRQSIEEEEVDGRLSIRIALDKSDAHKIDEIVERKLKRYYKRIGISDEQAAERIKIELPRIKSAAQLITHAHPEIKYEFSINTTEQCLEAVKIAYEIASMEFGDEYVLKSPVAANLRTALTSLSLDKISCQYGIDIAAMNFMMPSKNNHYVIMTGNVCIVSIFGMASIVQFCDMHEQFCLNQEKSIIYEFNAKERTHSKKLFIELAYELCNLQPARLA